MADRWTDTPEDFEPSTDEARAAFQRQAVKEGREAARSGEPVTYFHGRPYRDPGHVAD